MGIPEGGAHANSNDIQGKRAASGDSLRRHTSNLDLDGWMEDSDSDDSSLGDNHVHVDEMGERIMQAVSSSSQRHSKKIKTIPSFMTGALSMEELDLPETDDDENVRLRFYPPPPFISLPFTV